MAEATWDFETVKARMREAMQTLHQLPLGAGDRPSTLAAFWPTVVRNPNDSALQPQDEAFMAKLREILDMPTRGQVHQSHVAVPRYYPTDLPKERPSPEQVARAFEAIGWLFTAKLERQVRIALTARAIGVSRTNIARILHCSRQQTWRLEKKGIEAIIDVLKRPGSIRA